MAAKAMTVCCWSVLGYAPWGSRGLSRWADCGVDGRKRKADARRVHFIGRPVCGKLSSPGPRESRLPRTYQPHTPACLQPAPPHFGISSTFRASAARTYSMGIRHNTARDVASMTELMCEIADTIAGAAAACWIDSALRKLPRPSSDHIARQLQHPGLGVTVCPADSLNPCRECVVVDS
ncbi:hypothetical protein PENSPDRAFT_153887 [Peniophora sp. CONT]|nr:hypothetical protein PENSPDRAFT_153887 [Peniophora sp. CONT]